MVENMNVDIVFGLSWGDEGKGKIIGQLLRNKKYDWVCRWNGGANAGHTVYINNKKYHTHLIPSGILFGYKCLIGPDCFLNINDFKNELEYLSNNGFDTNLIKVSPFVNVITDEHKKEDANNPKSTGKGIGPCARDKFARIGKRFIDVCPDDLKHHIHNVESDDDKLKGEILCEGAQGFWLDINYGNYPYVTSSITLPYTSCSLGFAPSKIRNIYGAAKIYDTRVGYDPEFENLQQPNENKLKDIAQIGNEFGTTTGRKRSISWLDLSKLIKAINISGTNIIIISKIDILQNVNTFILKENNEYVHFNDLNQMKEYIEKKININCYNVNKIIFSGDPEFVPDL